MTSPAAERLAELDNLPGRDLVGRTELTLNTLVTIMNEETTLLRAGRVKQAGQLTGDKTRLAQDYVGLSRSIQRQLHRLRLEVPGELDRLKAGHERLATQMAENLRVIATARDVTEAVLTDVATAVGAQDRTRIYGAGGQIQASAPTAAARGIAINRAL
jgi:flagellar biosynthesis/type III secretory pathway chaperone